MEDFNWTCPYCHRDTVITNENYYENGLEISGKPNKYGNIISQTEIIICPNPNCREISLKIKLCESFFSSVSFQRECGKVIKEWMVMPNTIAKQFPDYIPKAILDDYNEACLIKDLSPKASATLSRRCLQGIIRNFWGVSKTRLVDEIAIIKDRIDPLAWAAIDSVRKIGNIGAHMEKDIDKIIDVDNNEAELLIKLIETLMQEWYINKHEREQRFKEIIHISTQKENEKKS